MSAAGAAVWGFVAVLALEGLDVAGALRRTGSLPWRRESPGPYAASVGIRVAAGAGIAALLAAVLPLTPAGAVGVGIAVPLLLSRVLVLFAVPASGLEPVPVVAAAPNGKVPRLRVRLPLARRKTEDDRET